MSILITVLLTILITANIFIISIIALSIGRFKDKNSRMGSIVLLAVLMIDILTMIGGAVL